MIEKKGIRNLKFDESGKNSAMSGTNQNRVGLFTRVSTFPTGNMSRGLRGARVDFAMKIIILTPAGCLDIGDGAASFHWIFGKRKIALRNFRTKSSLYKIADNKKHLKSAI